MLYSLSINLYWSIAYLTYGGIVGGDRPPAKHAEADALREALELALDALMMKLVQKEDASSIPPERGQVDLVRISGKEK